MFRWKSQSVPWTMFNGLITCWICRMCLRKLIWIHTAFQYKLIKLKSHTCIAKWAVASLANSRCFHHIKLPIGTISKPIAQRLNVNVFNCWVWCISVSSIFLCEFFFKCYSKPQRHHWRCAFLQVWVCVSVCVSVLRHKKVISLSSRVLGVAWQLCTD